uniref:Uncharacterized protein n=1 Tax=Taenioma perpusillum TaxID=210852 RepID=A0A1Z1MRI3_9FLOR|nr:hypothetical protein [Taenioma perpusillum]ARW68479.1 hypothetical protein [Taenioma perpusillum]
MKFDINLKNARYIDDIEIHFYRDVDEEETNSNLPVGWSSICLNETISFYVDHSMKNSYFTLDE